MHARAGPQESPAAEYTPSLTPPLTSAYHASTAATRLGYPHAMFSPTPLVPEWPLGQPAAQAWAVEAMAVSHTRGPAWWRALGAEVVAEVW
jgi:hypothetical protein